MRVNIQLMQCGQAMWSWSGPWVPHSTGAPFVTSSPSAGTMTVKEKALEDIFWQPRQWQAAVIRGGLVIRMWTWPQRQDPSRGREGVDIMFPWLFPGRTLGATGSPCQRRGRTGPAPGNMLGGGHG
ncbi:hypothetical protein KU6B_51330 [Mameliella alba]|nr:hypothetical protein KU6B_51330 [Mameliella alba]